MLTIKRVTSYEMGLLFRNGEIVGTRSAGLHLIFGAARLEVVSMRTPWLTHDKLDLIVASGVLDGALQTVDLADHERALVWIDGRFDRMLTPGLYALFTTMRSVRVEVIDTRAVAFVHDELAQLLKSVSARELGLEVLTVPDGHVGLVYLDGALGELLDPGRYAWWADVGRLRLLTIDLREQLLEVSGQELMTADRVTLRLNVSATWHVADPKQALREVADFSQALRREVQLVLRGAVGARTLDALLEDKEAVAAELSEGVRAKVAAFGLAVGSLGIKDVILPGEMKTLLNKVVEAKKVAEAAVITRREETAALRSQANSARLMAENPTLMRLKELEVLEAVAANSKLNVVMGEKGLAERVVNLL